MKKINVGLLGAGICANSFHFPALKQLSDRFNIVAIAGSDPAQNEVYAEKVGTTKIYNNFQELIRDSKVEAVISSFPYFMNADIVTAAKAEGKHILVEKPIAESIKQPN